MKNAFSEIARVLKPGGKFYVLLYNRRSLFYVVNVVLRHWLGGAWMHESLAQRRSRIEFSTANAAPLVNVYSSTELRDRLTEAGFDVESVEVRKFTPEDLPGARLLGSVYRRLPQRLYGWLGRRVGWYVIGRGRIPVMQSYYSFTLRNDQK